MNALGLKSFEHYNSIINNPRIPKIRENKYIGKFAFSSISKLDLNLTLGYVPGMQDLSSKL